jgi:hypothetical protein
MGVDAATNSVPRSKQQKLRAISIQFAGRGQTGCAAANDDGRNSDK